jgi:hypothetical protein
VDCLVTTAGGIEEDFIKCLGSTVLGDFHLDGAELRRKGWERERETAGQQRKPEVKSGLDWQTSLNRIGNLLVPNSNYCAFEDWVVPILDQMVAEQEGEEKVRWSPSKVIHRLGKEIDNEESVYYWCYKVGRRGAKRVEAGPVRLVLFVRHFVKPHLISISRRPASRHPTRPSVYSDGTGHPATWELRWRLTQNNIPVFCPALTDGSLGDMIYFHTYKTDSQLVIDIVSDIRRLNDMSVRAKQAGIIILGGGVCKHQIANAMLFVSAAGRGGHGRHGRLGRHGRSVVPKVDASLTHCFLCRETVPTTPCT